MFSKSTNDKLVLEELRRHYPDTVSYKALSDLFSEPQLSKAISFCCEKSFSEAIIIAPSLSETSLINGYKEAITKEGGILPVDGYKITPAGIDHLQAQRLFPKLKRLIFPKHLKGYIWGVLSGVVVTVLGQLTLRWLGLVS